MCWRSGRRSRADEAAHAANCTRHAQSSRGHPLIAEDRERFERDYGCTEREWLAWMPSATGGRERVPEGTQGLRVRVGNGQLVLRWSVLAPRVIALMRLPRLAVTFSFEGVPLEERREFLRTFDMHLQRGGG